MFEEMKRYVRFGPGDEAALRALLPHARGSFAGIADDFYARIHEHEDARRAISSDEQMLRLKRTLVEWMERLLAGPWDDAYFEKRARIGRMHVRISLPQRYMFGAMALIRNAFLELSRAAFPTRPDTCAAVENGLSKILDLELAIMLETYRESFVDNVQQLERLEKVLLEQRLAISEAKYVEIVEKAEALITTFAPGGEIVLFNGCCERTLQLPRAEAHGKNWFELFVNAEDREAAHGRCEGVVGGGRAEPFEAMVAHEGGSARRVRWHFTTLPTSGGALLCAIGIDVTEAHDLSMRTRRAERLASLGTMAAGLAHEIRNPLNAAHLQLTVLQRRLLRIDSVEVDGARAAAELVSSEMKRLAMLVEEFLQFARPQPVRLADRDLRATVEEVVALVGPEAQGGGVEVAVEAGGAVPASYDSERIKQVVLNLVRNAVEATGRGGLVRVAVAGAADGPCLRVVDDGPGIPADAPIFEPFFTTKNSGTGLGLAIVHRIVADHGGKVTFASRPGETAFTIQLLPPSTAGDPPS